MPAVRAQFVCSHLREGGAQQQWSLLISGLRDRGLDVSLLTVEDEGRYFAGLRAQGVDTRCARMRRRSDLHGFRRAIEARLPAPQVVVSHGVRSLVLSRLIARRAGAPHVAIDYRAPGFRFKPHQEALVRAAAPRVDRVVAASPSQIPDLLRRGYRTERIEVIHCGVERAALRPSRAREETRARLGLRDSDFAALLVSVFRPEKRVDAFVRAVALARGGEPRIRGIVAGDGPERPRIEASAAGAAGAVQLVGFREDVADLIVAADAVCLTSEVEIHPICFLEAMALERPVVGTDVGAMSEAVEDGVSGLLVPSGDDEAFAAALIRLARDPDLAGSLAQAGNERQRALFGAERMVDDYAALLERMVHP